MNHIGVTMEKSNTNIDHSKDFHKRNKNNIEMNRNEMIELKKKKT